MGTILNLYPSPKALYPTLAQFILRGDPTSYFMKKMEDIRHSVFFFFKKNIYLFIYLPAPGLSCCMWDLVPWPGIDRTQAPFIGSVES